MWAAKQYCPSTNIWYKYLTYVLISKSKTICFKNVHNIVIYFRLWYKSIKFWCKSFLHERFRLHFKSFLFHSFIQVLNIPIISWVKPFYVIFTWILLPSKYQTIIRRTAPWRKAEIQINVPICSNLLKNYRNWGTEITWNQKE